ncbi:hypothetical protein ACWGCK_04625 [Streptomyces virginiae]|uniref:hypothetical protein n=1 Tax=Streptomyces virginiae TaxID=1961 RepID=UPI003688FA8D
MEETGLVHLGGDRRGGPERIAALYVERGDRKLDRPEAEHGRGATPWIRHHVHEDSLAVARAFAAPGG